MAATSKTMAEVLASSSSSSSLTSSNHNNTKNSSNGDYAKAGSNVADIKEENGSLNIMAKTFPYLTITVYIPTACVGVLIGKRGSNIDSIQKLAAKESTKIQAGRPAAHSSRGARNKSAKQNKNNIGSGSNHKVVAPESVRMSVVNYPPPATNTQQNFDHYKNNRQGRGDISNSSASGQQQQQMGGSSIMDMGVPPTYTELDFSDPQWTPIVIRADPIASIYAANAIHDICYPEYVVDRSQLVYIIDIPVPAVASGNSNNANLRHASIVGKRGNKLIQLSADHKCRIMVPPKQLGHNVIQLEAPLRECCSCLKGISAKLQAGGPSGNEDKDSDATRASPTSPSSKNAKNGGAGNKTNNNNNNKGRNDNAKNNFQMALIIQPLPSQTKLRNIARKTETKILKKRIPKSQQRNQKQQQNQQKHEQDQESKQTDQGMEEVEASDQSQEKQEQGHVSNNNNHNNNANSNSDNKISWMLTVVANTEKKVMKAVDMLKVLNTKGYEVILEDSGPNNPLDASTKAVESMSGAPEDDADAGAGTDSSTNGGAIDGPKPTTPTGTPNGRSGGGGRGGRGKKQRHRGNYRGNNGKDSGKDIASNNNGGDKQPMTTSAGVDES